MTTPIRISAERLAEIRQLNDFGEDIWQDDADALISHIAWLDSEIARLEQELTRARGVAAQLLDDVEPSDQEAD